MLNCACQMMARKIHDKSIQYYHVLSSDHAVFDVFYYYYIIFASFIIFQFLFQLSIESSESFRENPDFIAPFQGSQWGRLIVGSQRGKKVFKNRILLLQLRSDQNPPRRA